MVDRTLFEKRINCKIRGLMLYFQLVLISTFIIPSSSSKSCGGYVDIGSGTKTFYSPNYPLQYDVASNCIWIIEASAYHRVNLTFSFTGERYSGECSDFIEIRDGGPSSPLYGEYCDTHTDVNLESTNVWMYVQLKTDQISGSGTSLTATARAIKNTTTPYDLTDRVPECRSYEFECANHMCVSMSYRCDNYNDCGCIDDCDEDGCGSLTIDMVTQISVAVTVGVLVFLGICFMAYIIESKNSWNTHKKIEDVEVNKAKQLSVSRRESLALIKLRQQNRSAREDSKLKLTDCEAC